MQSWDDELELLCQAIASDCLTSLKGSICLRTARYKITNLNNYGICSWPLAITTEEIINVAMHEWYDGHKNVRNLQDIESFGTTDVNANNYRQWGQLVKSKANRVGCTVLEYSNDDSKCKTVLCNYSGGIIQHEPIFTIGAPASLCKMGANPKYPGLCNPDEDFSQHKSGKHYFDNNAPESPVVGKWLENGKKLNLRVD